MALYRRVTGRVLYPSGVGWSGGVITFRLNASSYTGDAQFAAAAVKVTLGADGEIRGLSGSVSEEPGVSLWCEDEGFVAVQYLCTLPDKTDFRFHLAPGDGSSISLSTLRTAGATAAPSSDPLYDVIREMIEESAFLNLDGGEPDSQYGGIPALDGGSV